MEKLTEQQLQKIANPSESDIGGTQSPIVTQMAIELLDLRDWRKTADMCTNELAAVSSENRKLRAELAELNNQEPIGQVISCNGNKTLGWINDAPEGTLLFAAAKPAGV